ncbi:uncharacterized protein (TIGR03435 family) [Granulicella aggregans]|uniref:Uncharacterized protein (TIGR03435 family) n=1 Tax=Granulicella aggregans TaxID=474949 RepID=A0A7W7ZBG2_9BACT|nr:TIGR03435 family protein [Granulicella aggregans]MBB5056829.1 uncharacterized protein (TIGR03435 family) [Granulicella aggregans]
MKLFALCFVCNLATCSAIAQSAASPTQLAFDVAAVRPSKPDASPRSNVPLDAGNVYGTIDADDDRSAASGLFIATHQALWRYITFAYKLSGTQELALRFNMFSGAPKSDAPSWVTGTFTTSPEFFDISARAPADTSIDQMRLMMQALLVDRFHLVIRYVTADAPVFALVVAKYGATGPNLKPHSQSDFCVSSAPDPSLDSAPHPAATPSSVGDLPPICGVIAHVPSSAPGQHYGARAVSLSLFATSIPTMTGLAIMPRPVVDDTGLSGLYDFTLSWVHDSADVDAAIDDNSANFRDSLKNQLGLKLQPSHAPLSFLVIDHVERPSEN